MNQRKAIGISLTAFAVLMITVCVIYQVVTPSAGLENMWFSHLIGTLLLAIGLLMTLA
jgi:hypothetical protein